MEREQLEHVLRASAAITNCRDFVIVGSQALLGEHPDAAAELKQSIEVDLYPLDVPELADLIDGSIGEGSMFQATFGDYAQGVGPKTAVLPSMWEQRVVRIESPATGGAVGYWIDTHDLAISKFVANQEKDRESNAALIRAGLIEKATLLKRCDLLANAEHETLVRARIERAFGAAAAE